MTMTVERIKTHGTYLGFYEQIGYLYIVANSLYTFNRYGITKL